MWKTTRSVAVRPIGLVYEVFMDSLDEILELERKIAALVENVKRACAEEVLDADMIGVKKTGNGSCIISLSTIRDNGLILSAEYYLQEAQAGYISQALKNTNSVSEFQTKIRTMCENKYVKIGQNRHLLNPNTVEVLKHYMRR